MQIRRKVLLVSLVVSGVLLSVGLSGLRGSSGQVEQQKKSQSPKPDPDYIGRLTQLESEIPAANVTEDLPKDTKKLAKRQAKNQRYNNRRMVKSTPNRDIAETTRSSDWEVGLPAMPADQAQIVVVGDVLDAQAHLSDDKTGIYSEFTFRITETLKQATIPLPAGSVVTLEREGGFVKHAADYKRLYRIQGQGMPRVGRRYVLFLNPVGTDDDYAIVTGYELHAGKVQPLDSTDQFAVHTGANMETFMELVREAVAQSNSANREVAR